MTRAKRSGTEPETPMVERVLLAVESTEGEQDLLAAASDLARGLGAELSCLFVENIALLRMAALPFTREIGLFSGIVRPIDSRELERMLERQAERVRRRLSEVAAEHALPWSFQVTRGRLLDEVLEAAAETDLVMLAPRPAAARRAMAAASPPAPPVAVSALFDPGEAGPRVLAAALELAHGSLERLSVLVPAAGGSIPDSTKKRAAASLRVPEETLQFWPIADLESGALARRTRGRQLRALVLSMNSLTDARAQLSLLLEEAGCALVLVR
jgi:hypothetical protein